MMPHICNDAVILLNISYLGFIVFMNNYRLFFR